MRLRDHTGIHVNAGVTDREERKRRFRAAITDNGLEQVIVNGKDGKAATYSDAFRWLYAEEL